MPDIVIVAAAVITPVGLHAAQTCASVRAGISRTSVFKWRGTVCKGLFSASLPDGCLEDLVADQVVASTLAPVEKRILRLAGSTAEQLVHVGLEEIPLLIGLGNGFDRFEDREILTMVAGELRTTIDPESSGVLKQGRAAGLMAIRTACDMLADGRAEKVLAGGVDSYHDPDLLGRLNIENRMTSQTAADGFIPGEGAALVLLMEASAAEWRGYPVLGTISAWTDGFEPGHLASDQPCHGNGLAGTFQRLLDARSFEKIATVYTSMNGESYWAKEWSIASLRCHEHFARPMSLHHPAQYYGDPGAASGPIMTVLAATGIELGYRQGPALVYAASDHGQRCAVIVNNNGERQWRKPHSQMPEVSSTPKAAGRAPSSRISV